MADEEIVTEPLVVELIHMYPFENAQVHHTDRFQQVHAENRVPVLRRGETFNMALRFSERNFNEYIDQVKFEFSIGENPNVFKRTKGAMFLRMDTPQEDHLQWNASLVAVQDDTLHVEITSPSDAPVGLWKLNVVTFLKNDPQKQLNTEYEGDIYILFNPWNKSDQVYMEETELLDEYILNDIGKIWVGPVKSTRGREWVFGQFDEIVLPACMLMMDMAKLPELSRGDPVKVCRTISMMANSSNDIGILAGNWSGDYADGVSPSAWTGSVNILKQFLETQNNVGYGQCWVFAGLVVTICRALGIPVRAVTNLVSAHDANNSLTIDKYYSANMEELHEEDMNDMIWNYHVWNEVWMSRPDLPKGYGGWQAIDATPQEKSENVYQCGPASIEAIRKGAVGHNYDVPFLLASVNADLMRWKEDPNSPLGFSIIDSNKYTIGRQILTKIPHMFDPLGDEDRLDITSQYKDQEGSEGERLALYNGVRGSERAKRFYGLPDKNKEDVEFDLIELETINIGEPFSVTVEIINNSSEERTINAMLKATSIYYTGVKAHIIKTAEGKFTMRPNNKEKLNLTIDPDEYLDKMVEYCNMKIDAICKVEETQQMWAGEDDFQVIKPTIEIKLGDELGIQKESVVSLTFVNPLRKTLTNCTFRLEGPGLTKRSIVIPHHDVAPGATLWSDVAITPSAAGSLRLIATFESSELVDVRGSLAVDVY